MRLVLLAVTAVSLQLSTAAVAQSPTGQYDRRITGEEILAGVISEIERRTIGRYYRGDEYWDYEERYGYGKGKKGKSKSLPPGLARRDLPPGLQKHLDERGSLPPGLAKRDLPPDLRAILPRRAGQDFVIVDDDVLLIERATGLVLDVIEGVTAPTKRRRDADEDRSAGCLV